MALWLATQHKIELNELTGWLARNFPKEELRRWIIDSRNQEFQKSQPKWWAEFITLIFLLEAIRGMVIREVQQLLHNNRLIAFIKKIYRRIFRINEDEDENA